MSFSIVGSGTVGSMTLGVYPRRFRITATSYGNVSGGSTPPVFPYVVDITPYVKDDWSITQQLGQPSRLTFTMLGDIPLQEGLGVRVSLTPPKGGQPGNTVPNADFGDVLFAGNMTEVTTTLQHIGQRPTYAVQAQDLTWLLNRRAQVRGTFGSVGFNTVVGQILSAYTEFYDGFAPGSIPQSLGNAPLITFNGATVLEALNQFATAANAYVQITPDRHVHLFQDPAHLSTADSITNTSRNAYNLRVYRDLTNVVDAVTVWGKTTRVATKVFSSTAVAVTDGSIFSPVANPTVYIGNEQLATVGSIQYQPPAYPTADALLILSQGVSGFPEAGEPVQHYATRSVTAVNSLILRMTDGVSNVRRYEETNTELTAAEVQARATLLAARLSDGYTQIEFAADDERHQLGKQLSVGQRIAVAITSPVTISQNRTLMVQALRIEQAGTIVNSTVDIKRTAQAGLQSRTQTLDDTLAGLKTTS